MAKSSQDMLMTENQQMEVNTLVMLYLILKRSENN